MAVSVAGTPLIQGAKTVAVNAFRRYDDAPLAAAPDVTGKRPQEITQGYLDGIDGENQTYMNAALANPAVAARRPAWARTSCVRAWKSSAPRWTAT